MRNFIGTTCQCAKRFGMCRQIQCRDESELCSGQAPVCTHWTTRPRARVTRRSSSATCWRRQELSPLLAKEQALQAVPCQASRQEALLMRGHPRGARGSWWEKGRLSMAGDQPGEGTQSACSHGARSHGLDAGQKLILQDLPIQPKAP
jgi:hypothetical protein